MNGKSIVVVNTIVFLLEIYQYHYRSRYCNHNCKNKNILFIFIVILLTRVGHNFYLCYILMIKYIRIYPRQKL